MSFLHRRIVFLDVEIGVCCCCSAGPASNSDQGKNLESATDVLLKRVVECTMHHAPLIVGRVRDGKRSQSLSRSKWNVIVLTKNPKTKPHPPQHATTRASIIHPKIIHETDSGSGSNLLDPPPNGGLIKIFLSAFAFFAAAMLIPHPLDLSPSPLV
ncbi:hypothetical protein L6452_09406 [Arctium lappa]|uniref:Uncharacterized protein n=1 Tax=Arctium lappa TaxID=4217 RepID=A0ACB9DJX2_ARCLA|nr:hypothetical protein L6452_09406 [Arctium lappa]